MNREPIFLTPDVLAKLEISPEANLFHLTPFDDAEQIELQTLTVEQRHPIVLRRGADGALLIVDGRRRRRFAVHNDLGLWAVVLDDDANVLKEVLDIQFSRRETTKTERALVVARPEVREHFQREAKQRQGKRDLQPSAVETRGQWTVVAGMVAKVGKEAIRQAVAVADNGIPVLVDLLLREEVALLAAAEFTKTNTREQQQAMFESLPLEEFSKRVAEMGSKRGRARSRSRAAEWMPRARFNVGSSEALAQADDVGEEELPDASNDITDVDETDADDGKRLTSVSSNDEVVIHEAATGVAKWPNAAIQPAVDIALGSLFGGDPKVCRADAADAASAFEEHDVVIATGQTTASCVESLLRSATEPDLALVLPSPASGPHGQALLRAVPTCIVAADENAHGLLVSYFGTRIGTFVAAFTTLGAVVVPAPLSAPSALIFKLDAPGGSKVRAHRHDNDVWVSPKDVASGIGATGANVIDKGLPSLLLPNGRDPKLKVVPARAVGQRLRERPTLIAKLQGAEREAWCAFLEGAGGAA